MFIHFKWNYLSTILKNSWLVLVNFKLLVLFVEFFLHIFLPVYTSNFISHFTVLSFCFFCCSLVYSCLYCSAWCSIIKKISSAVACLLCYWVWWTTQDLARNSGNKLVIYTAWSVGLLLTFVSCLITLNLLVQRPFLCHLRAT